jgi:hypothetical protein
MEKLKDKLSTFGGILSGLGILSCILAIFNYEVNVLAWVNLWGTPVAWAIRIGLILGGLAIFKIFKSATEETAAEEAPMDWNGYYRSLLSDPMFSRFLDAVRGKYPISFQPVADGRMYRVAHLQLSNNQGGVVASRAQDIYLANAYLERDGGRERLLVGATMTGGAWDKLLNKPLSHAEWTGYIPAGTSPDLVSNAAKMATGQ